MGNKRLGRGLGQGLSGSRVPRAAMPDWSPTVIPSRVLIRMIVDCDRSQEGKLSPTASGIHLIQGRVVSHLGSVSILPSQALDSPYLPRALANAYASEVRIRSAAAMPESS